MADCHLPPEIPVGTGLLRGTHTHWMSQKLPLPSASTCPDSSAPEVPDFHAYLNVRRVHTLSPFPDEQTASQAPCSRRPLGHTVVFLTTAAVAAIQNLIIYSQVRSWGSVFKITCRSWKVKWTLIMKWRPVR